MSMRSFFCLFPTTHPSLSLLKIQQDMTQSELSQLIAALRAFRLWTGLSLCLPRGYCPIHHPLTR